jgi:hypothetical protein
LDSVGSVWTVTSLGIRADIGKVSIPMVPVTSASATNPEKSVFIGYFHSRGAFHLVSQPGTRTSFDEIDVLVLAQVDALQVGASSVGVGGMQVKHAGFGSRDQHRNFVARGEIGDNCL